MTQNPVDCLSVLWSEPLSGPVEEWQQFCEEPESMQTARQLEFVADLPNGHALYREPNGAGGHRYWSSEIGGGVCLWDTCLIDSETLLAAIVEERRRITRERRAAGR